MEDKRTFRLIKDLPDATAGALFQQMEKSIYSTGAGDNSSRYYYTSITPELIKGESTQSIYDDPSAVEEEPEYFVEVFKTIPDYMTREEREELTRGQQ